MAVKLLFIGDVTEYLKDIAVSHDPGAFLLTDQNLAVLDDNKDHTCYTSLGDLPMPINEIWQVLQKVQNIKYCPPEIWSDQKIARSDQIWKSVQGATEFLLAKIQNLNHNVQGLDLGRYCKNYTRQSDTRQVPSAQLWISGCSFSAGTGVDAHERYGHLLGKMLDKPVSWLAEPGSSTEFHADQILRADIKNHDIVVWGLTNHERFTVLADDDEILHITQAHRQRARKATLPEKIVDMLLTDRSLFYQTIIHVHQVVNYCRKIGAKLLIVGLRTNQETEIYLSTIKEFVQYSRPNEISPQLLDYAINDPYHPGPKQHLDYANFCFRQLKKLHYI